MYHMVLFVIDDVDDCPSILDAWEAAGAVGVTILESTGLGRVRESGIRDDIPLMPSIMNLLRTQEEHHRTLFTVVDSEERVDRLIDVTQQIVGDLEQPNKGVIFVLPVTRAVGLSKGKKDSEE